MPSSHSKCLNNSVHELVLPTTTGQGSLVHQKARILELPLDIWGEISSHSPRCLFHTDVRPVSPLPWLLAPSTMLTYSGHFQTCRCLRAMYLRQFWEQFEACSILLCNSISSNKGSLPFNWKNHLTILTSVAEFSRI